MKKIKQLLEGYKFIFEIIGYSALFYFAAYVLFNLAFLFRA